jgi:ribosomal protein L34E
VRIRLQNPDLLVRYGFGLRTADFLLCGRCGSYLGALMTERERMVATINVNTFEPPHPFQRDGVPMSYEGESDAERRVRRAAGWTPVVTFD